MSKQETVNRIHSILSEVLGMATSLKVDDIGFNASILHTNTGFEIGLKMYNDDYEETYFTIALSYEDWADMLFVGIESPKETSMRLLRLQQVCSHLIKNMDEYGKVRGTPEAIPNTLLS